MLTSSGPKCDGCKKYILPVFNETMDVYAIPCTDAVLHAHQTDECRRIVLRKAEIMTDIVNAAISEYLEPDSAQEDLNEIRNE